MSDQPLMTPQQEKTTLSAKKLRKKGRIIRSKLTLRSPYTKNQQPTVSQGDKIKQLLAQFPLLVPPKPEICWSEIKEVKKADRANYRRERQKPQELDVSNIKNQVVLGINSVTIGLENDNIAAVLLSHDINPFFMVKHVVELCNMKNVPLVMVEGLREALKQHIGVASACFGIKSNATGQSNKESNALSGAKSQIAPNESKQIISLLEEIRSSANNWSEQLPSHCLDDYFDECLEDEVVFVKEEAKTREGEPPMRNLHLQRSDKTRVFVPTSRRRDDGFNADFIEFADVPQAQPQMSKMIGLQVAKVLGKKKTGKTKANKVKGGKVEKKQKKKNRIQPNKIVQPKARV